jgi:hypothetical protein
MWYWAERPLGWFILGLFLPLFWIIGALLPPKR